ncbi:anthranilate synthase component 1 [Paenibacillus sp. cl6col]|uniref:anthranilate synthase component I n=1 Tax=Paenibacillus sp. cl6col TaxID=1761878 RepID=UPI000882EB53|nr:anthranilate synthase component I [Paenibacillus sp. cl6col]SDE71235.1 anthranilate synthase component 1 [Paenibacillus sp. cl6col]
MYPQLDEVIHLARQYNVIPVAETMMADTETPIRLFQRLRNEPYAFLLESVEGGVQWARYSFIGTDPFLLLQGKSGRLRKIEHGHITEVRERPIEMMKHLMHKYRSPALDGLPPMTGGAIGCFGYDLVQQYERLPRHKYDTLQMDDIRFMFCDQLVAFDHMKQQMQFIVNIHVEPGSSVDVIRHRYEQARKKLRSLQMKLTAPLVSNTRPVQQATAASAAEEVLQGVRSSETKESFVAKVDRAKEYIRSGDIFQVVLSQRFERQTQADPLDVYRVLRMTNPSPYMYVLKTEDDMIVGTSPEMLVRIKDERVETRPIAGTRPRGATAEVDAALEVDLMQDEKERAEHVMLVDLGRNDLGRVCEFGSVRCDTYMNVERYSHVMHIVSNVSGKLRKNKDFFDAFLSCLPAGTLSGAPKLRAMEIIAELEEESRGIYGGAIGYLGFNGNMDSCITIRTIIFRGGHAYVQAGAGVVWDSVPEMEYEETINKAKALLLAIRMTEEMFSREGDAEGQEDSVNESKLTNAAEGSAVGYAASYTSMMPANWDYYIGTEERAASIPVAEGRNLG